jgi:hypothetical protein
MVKKYAWWIAVVLSTLLLVYLLIYKPFGTPQPAVLKPAWLSRWLESPVCAPPCWENITPGISQFSEAEDVMLHLPEVGIPYISVGRLDFKQKTLSWSFKNSSNRGAIYSDEAGKLVLTIGIEIQNLGNPLTIQEIIAHFGPADQISLLGCTFRDGSMCHARLLYLKTGLAIQFRASTIDENNNDQHFKINVRPENEVEQLLFSIPGIEEYVLSTNNFGVDRLDRIWDWKGYGEYLALNFEQR